MSREIMTKLACQVFGYMLCVFCFTGAGSASEVGWPMQTVELNPQDKPSLQRGARLYVNYCLGCHSLQYQRYERTADDLEIPHDIALKELIFTGQKIGELMVNSMPDESKNWFGAPPPDLTLVSRLRGPEWIYNYLKTFYVDESRPFGVNNMVFPNVGMPHVLLDLQGIQRSVCKQVPIHTEDGWEKRDPLEPGKALTERKCGQLELVEGSGAYSSEEYDQAVKDIVTFLDYVGEPARSDRKRIGVYVILFLILLSVFTYLLNREYWKDVH